MSHTKVDKMVRNSVKGQGVSSYLKKSATLLASLEEVRVGIGEIQSIKEMFQRELEKYKQQLELAEQ